MAKTRLTAEKYDELKAELKYLKEHRVDEVATLLKEARAFRKKEFASFMNWRTSPL